MLGSMSNMELCVFSVCVLYFLPFVIKKCKGNPFSFIEQMFVITSVVALIASFFDAINALKRGATLFNGRIIHPAIFFTSFILQVLRLTIKVFDYELYGYGVAGDTAKKDPKYSKLFGLASGVLMHQFTFCRMASVVGIPGLDGYDNPMSWLSLYPLVNSWFRMQDYYFGTNYLSGAVDQLLDKLRAFVFFYSYWALTEDFVIVSLIFLFCDGAPWIARKVAPAVGKNVESLIKIAGASSIFYVQYFGFKLFIN